MTGMRCGEARALTWEDIDLDNNIIHIRHTLIKVGNGVYKLEEPKTDNSRRTIPMLGAVRDILKELYGEGKSGKEYVFTLKNKPVVDDRVNKEIAKIEKCMLNDGIEVGHITAHTLRHAFATRAIEEGMKPQVLKKILGHSKIAITMDLYSHVLDTEKEKEMQFLESYFKKEEV